MTTVLLRESTVTIGEHPLTIDDVVRVARNDAQVRLHRTARTRIARARKVVDSLVADSRPHYGISTGFGALASSFIAPADRMRLQQSLIRSHTAGAGPEVEREVVRALMLLRIRTLASGRTGVRPVVVDTYLAVLNAGITPIVREYGSLGCSGDLAPLSHCALALIGEGRVRDASGTELPAAEALAAAGIAPLALEEKEGLALINGTDGMLGMLALALADLRILLVSADITAAMSTEALLGTDSAWASDVMALRQQAGQQRAAANLTAVIADSDIRESHRGPQHEVVQDAYSVRCAPQVHGAVRDTWTHAVDVAERELASSIDNPAVLASGDVVSNGNFHGAPVGYVLDFLAIAAADLASMAERRVDHTLDPKRNQGLPAFLAHDVGVDSGLMIAQYTAAGLVSEMKRLAVPASVDSIPSSAMKEDHVSMGWHAARKLRRSIDALAIVLGIELITAARALDLRSPLQPGPATAAVRERLRELVAGPGPDAQLTPDIDAAARFVATGALRDAAEAVTGPLL